jgi:hypothetical protein
MAGFLDYIPPFLPTKPKTSYNSASFPNDLIADGRQFATRIEFLQYSDEMAGVDVFGLIPFSTAWYLPTGGFTLPLPKKINEIQSVIWKEESAVDVATSAAAGVINLAAGSAARATAFAGQQLAGIASNIGAVAGGLIDGGLAINPVLFMLFQRPAFKEYTFSWTLAPNNEQESETLVNIIEYFKVNMLPSKSGINGLLWNYPKIAIVKFYPDDTFTFRLKPCAILSVQVDYSGAGGPSFFKNGAPTVVNFTVLMKEIQLNTADNYFT